MAGELEAVNVIDLFAERIRRARSLSGVPAAFENDIKTLLKETTALDYDEVRNVLYGTDKEFLRSAHDQGQSAQDFVDFTIAANKLATRSDDMDMDDVRGFNNNRVAILEFVDENRQDGWERSLDGMGFKEMHDGNGTFTGVALMQPVQNRNEWGFGVAVYGVDAIQDATFVAGSEPVKKFGGYDIEDVALPLYAYESELNNAALSYGR
jgi:hypothetical protein